MIFEWDDAKDEATRQERGFGFADAAGIFLGRTLEWQDTRKDYGEVRMKAVGEWDGDYYTVTYTDRVDAEGEPVRRIISAHLAHRKEQGMARISLSELRTRASTVDRAKLDATTDSDIEAQRAEDEDASIEVPSTAHTVEPPKALRVRLGMTQPEMAAALGIPLGTWRNWEQGRVSLEPAASALLRIVSHNPDMALGALALPDVKPSSRIADTETPFHNGLNSLAVG